MGFMSGGRSGNEQLQPLCQGRHGGVNGEVALRHMPRVPWFAAHPCKGARPPQLSLPTVTAMTKSELLNSTELTRPWKIRRGATAQGPAAG